MTQAGALKLRTGTVPTSGTGAKVGMVAGDRAVDGALVCANAADTGRRADTAMKRMGSNLARAPHSSAKLVVYFSCFTMMVLAVLRTPGMAASTSTRKRW